MILVFQFSTAHYSSNSLREQFYVLAGRYQCCWVLAELEAARNDVSVCLSVWSVVRYDNEYGYSTRVTDLVKFVNSKDHP